jgi:hypothetical protein
MEQDENREPQEADAEAQEDLEVSSDEAEGVAGGLLRTEDPDMGGQFA